MSPDSALSRRDFLQSAAAIAAALSTGRPAQAQQTQPASVLMPTRELGKTGLKVPILQMGGSFRQSPVLIKRALELGVNFFDTSAYYMRGRAEGIVGEALGSLAKRKDFMIVTKGRTKESPAEVLDELVPASLERLKMDYLDVWFIHGLDDPSLLTQPEWKTTAEKLKKSGKARFFGFSCHGKNVVDLLTTAAKVGYVDVIMFRHNFRTYGDAELSQAIDAACKAKIGLIAMKAQGAVTDYPERLNPFEKAGLSKHQAALRFVWQDERIASICSEMTSLRILEENAAAAFWAITDAETRLLQDWADRTAEMYCPGGSGLCRRQCEAACGSPVAIADTLRFLTYHDSYGRPADARRLFAELPASQRPTPATNLSTAEKACPLHLPVATLVRQAVSRMG